MRDTTPDLNDMRIFAAVGTARSFTGAGQKLGVPKATVSRRIRALEHRLGVRLLVRTTRKVSLTDAGRAFLERCLRIEEEVSDAEAAVRRLGSGPRGTLRVTAPYSLCRVLVLPFLPEFLRQYPEVRVALTLRNEPEDLVGRGAEVALTPWPVRTGGHATRLLGSMPTRLYASPAYLEHHGTPSAPHDLSQHPTLLYAGGGAPPRQSWTLTRGPRTETVPLFPALVCNDQTPLQAAALAGAGIVLSTRLLAEDAVRSGALVPVLPEWRGPPVEVRVVFPSRSALFPRARAFVDLLVRRAGPPIARAEEMAGAEGEPAPRTRRKP
ncbi:MAG TPA: LysR substrate-binding domain-containing protein [Anaeromyxobacteraceae bacterium]|nr:LysR substrate-binding domain-containing protein [Anaeromyxobacteraceae bacterium]